MKKDKIYPQLVAKMHQVSVLPPQTVGPLTPLYKRLVPYFKFYPWKSAVLLSIVGTLFLYLILGRTLIKIVSILQSGF